MSILGVAMLVTQCTANEHREGGGRLTNYSLRLDFETDVINLILICLQAVVPVLRRWGKGQFSRDTYQVNHIP